MNAAIDRPRARGLDSPLTVLGVFAALVAMFVIGMQRSPHAYSDVRFVIGFFATEAQVAIFLALATLVFFPAGRLGLRLPRLEGLDAPGWRGLQPLLPLALLLVVAAGCWAATRASVPAGAAGDAGTSWLILRTTALVGLNEEWIFRGLVLAALCRWWGWRRGAWGAMAAFGAFHLLNVLVGVSPAGAAGQFVLTFLAGAVFVVAAVGTRSLLLPMVGHALYDFFVIDMTHQQSRGATLSLSLVVLATGLLVGAWCLWRVHRLQAAEPYPG